MLKLICGTFLIVILFFLGCKSINSNFDTLSSTLELHFSHRLEGQPFALNQSLQNVWGEEVRGTLLKYYISNIRLKTLSGKDYVIPESYYLIDESQSESKKIVLNNLPPDDYSEISFTIGVDSLRNVSGLQTGALDPLNAMFWTWATGYIFLRFEGYSSASPSGAFVYHVAGIVPPNNCIRQKTFAMPTHHITLTAIKPKKLFFEVELGEMFKNPSQVRISQINNVMGGANATILANNYVDMFSIVKVE
ncbi:MAG: hypothetical protein EAZ55_02360 [Cytophagales bacterium]|nr:MAG: hypothetical protein EAZ55_02360 [Cytophagales bacterium]